VQFTRLKLTGFKSFVDPTELVVEPGLSGIVGPNGCGKSNLVEALRWVMGETSPKSMRGGAMDDVIFAGTANRPARNLAEVALEMDNADRSAPAAVNDADELQVSRKIQRESGSTYRINGREMRARDVQLLFADAATGAHSPALVSQGRIGTLINAKARDRRAILEEAAGITGLHSRRHEAELRLRAAENNLVRLEDVTGQIETQLQSLKRQSRQATRYRKVSEQIRVLEATLLYVRWQEASKAVEVAAEDLKIAEGKVQQMTGDAAAASTRQASLQQELPALRQSEAEAAAAVHRLTAERNNLDAEAKRLAEAKERLLGRLAQVAQDVERDTAQGADAEAAKTRLAEERAEIELAQSQQGETEVAATAQVATAEATLAAEEKTLDELGQRSAALTARRRQLDQQVAEAQKRVDRLKSQLAKIEEERQQQDINQEQAAKADQAAAGVTDARRTLDKATHDLEESQRTRTDAQTAETHARSTLDDASRVLTRIDAEIAALNQSLAVDENDLWPAVVDEIDADPGYEAALGAALGDDLSAPSDEGAPVHWAQRGGASTDVADLPAGASPLADHVKAPPVLERRLRQIGVVAEEDGVRLAGELVQGQRLVSPEGSLWRWDGFTTTHEAATPAAMRLAQRNRLKEIDQQRPEAAASTEQGKARVDEVKSAVEAATGIEKAAREAWRSAGQAMDKAQEDYATAMSNASDHDKRAAALAEATTRISDDLSETEARLVETNNELEDLPAGDGLQSELTEKREHVDGLRTSYAESRSALAMLEQEARARASRLDAIGRERAAWESRAEGARRHLEELSVRQQDAQTELKDTEDRPEQIEISRRALADQSLAAENVRKVAADALAEAETRLAQVDKEVREVQEALSLMREDRVRAEAARDQGVERQSGIAERIREVLECQPDQVPAVAEFDPEEEFAPTEQMETRVEKLKRERENIGAVNLRAEQEAQELDEQLQTLLSERQDLEAAIARLRQGIGSLNREGRERLLKAFTQVNEHFSNLFVRLYGGGRAHLELTESDDPLEAGLEIMASPPGKRLQVMSLLSGGEQALTALALIFAVFLTNPAPICVLDEVDAPLDDANVDRFCGLLREIADATQTRFLIVSHNVVTMSRMDRLFGVTMTERGVSNLVSVDLAMAEDMAAVG
jgi:chromosome segregation protein